MAEYLGVEEPRHGEGPTKTFSKDNKKCLVYGGSDDMIEPHDELGMYYTHTVIFLGSKSGEGSDRKTLGFGQETEDMVKRVGQWNKQHGKKTIVVMTVPGASTTNFRDDVDAILVHFYPGEMAA
jgi:hypothetical protein